MPGFGFPLAEGSAVALRCEVDSNPPSAPHWRKDEMDPPVCEIIIKTLKFQFELNRTNFIIIFYSTGSSK